MAFGILQASLFPASVPLSPFQPEGQMATKTKKKSAVKNTEFETAVLKAIGELDSCVNRIWAIQALLTATSKVDDGAEDLARAASEFLYREAEMLANQLYFLRNFLGDNGGAA